MIVPQVQGALAKLVQQNRAITLDKVIQQQKARLHMQVQAAALEKSLDGDIADMADHFSIDEPLARQFDAVMQSRGATFEADFMTVWGHLEKSEDPSDTLLLCIRELAEGTFITKSKRHSDIVNLCKDYRLDHMAERNLIEAMSIREREEDSNIGRDLEKLEEHLAHSSQPSKLISMKLKELRAGCNIGAVWHCCGDSKKKPRDRVKEVPLDGGIGIEGVRGQGAKHGTYKSYTDHELEQRDQELSRKSVSSNSGSGKMMTEEQALRFQHNMRQEAKSRSRHRERRDERDRSRSRGGGQSRGGRGGQDRHERREEQDRQERRDDRYRRDERDERDDRHGGSSREPRHPPRSRSRGNGAETGRRERHRRG